MASSNQISLSEINVDDVHVIGAKQLLNKLARVQGLLFELTLLEKARELTARSNEPKPTMASVSRLDEDQIRMWGCWIGTI